MVEPAMTAVLTPDGQSIITSSRLKRGSLTMWNFKPVLRRSIREGEFGPSTRAAGNDRAHITGSELPGLQARLSRLTLPSFYSDSGFNQSGIDCLSISSDGELLASGSGFEESPGQLKDHNLVLWDRVTGRPMMKLWGPAFKHVRLQWPSGPLF